MKKFIASFFLGVVVLLMSFSSYSQSNFSSKLIGLGVVVSDLDKSLDFYVDGIGMVKTGGFNINEDFAKRSGLSNGVPFSVTVLKLENSPDANEWKLISFGKKVTHPKQNFIQDDAGVQYITINVKALKPIIERLKQKKIPLLGSTPTSLNGNMQFV